MVRPARNKKPVNYSQFEDSDSDDDFIPATVPLNKKSRTTPKELKQDKPKPALKTVQKEDILLQEKTPKKRVALDDKIFQRGIEAALALSVKEHLPVTSDVQKSQDKSIKKHDRSKTETMNKSLHISNCSVAGDYLDLDRITEESDTCVRGKRKTPEAAVRKRKMLSSGSDGSSASDTEPDETAGEDSENDTDCSESEDNEEEFTMRKSKVKENKKKEVKVKSPVEKKEKKSNSKLTAIDSSPATIKSESQSSPREISCSKAARKAIQIQSPSAESRRPKWVPPASVSSGSGSSPLAVVTVKSPNQNLRLGLS
ncbi:RAD51-associated protein 1, partial [Octodon degus]|uniref:RAD51-associated protein 1 n=1 Tax=Octodon degus TaxID=10160 RepID=A0A6P6DIP6_OCTDE